MSAEFPLPKWYALADDCSALINGVVAGTWDMSQCASGQTQADYTDYVKRTTDSLGQILRKPEVVADSSTDKSSYITTIAAGDNYVETHS
tara:strand:- start:514 stop:783 length:270 start_codon:yes stop_codon:yes gene_type:complete